MQKWYQNKFIRRMKWKIIRNDVLMVVVMVMMRKLLFREEICVLTNQPHIMHTQLHIFCSFISLAHLFCGSHQKWDENFQVIFISVFFKIFQEREKSGLVNWLQKTRQQRRQQKISIIFHLSGINHSLSLLIWWWWWESESIWNLASLSFQIFSQFIS